MRGNVPTPEQIEALGTRWRLVRPDGSSVEVDLRIVRGRVCSARGGLPLRLLPGERFEVVGGGAGRAVRAEEDRQS